MSITNPDFGIGLWKKVPGRSLVFTEICDTRTGFTLVYPRQTATVKGIKGIKVDKNIIEFMTTVETPPNCPEAS